jgi:hypothetical protein
VCPPDWAAHGGLGSVWACVCMDHRRPTEMLVLVLKHLGSVCPKALATAAPHVCRRWRRVCKDDLQVVLDLRWAQRGNSLLARENPITDDALEAVANRFRVRVCYNVPVLLYAYASACLCPNTHVRVCSCVPVLLRTCAARALLCAHVCSSAPVLLPICAHVRQKGRGIPASVCGRADRCGRAGRNLSAVCPRHSTNFALIRVLGASDVCCGTIHHWVLATAVCSSARRSCLSMKR